MNERIEQLKQQAYQWCDENIPERFHPESGDYGSDWENKFAELIIRECMEVFSKDLPEPGDGKMLEVINRVCNVAEHFGVKK